MSHSRPGRPVVPDELRRIPYSSRMSKHLLDWLRSQPEPMTEVLERLVTKHKRDIENGPDADSKVISELKELVSKLNV